MQKWLVIIIAACAGRACAGISIVDPGQGVYDFTGSAEQLSGLAWGGGTNWYAISDHTNQRKVHRLDISLNSSNGRITGASVAGEQILATGYDLEGITYCPVRGTWFVSDEGQHPAGGYVREHTLPDGALVQSLSIPAPMLKDRANLGFESCSWGAAAMWTTTEEALNHESARSTAGNGTLVRLQKFNHLLQPAGQWVYQTDSYGYDSPLTSAELSGISDLVALPDGNLLVLERALGINFIPSFRNRIYLVDFADATDVSDMADLDVATYTAAAKTLLWDKNMGTVTTHNFEGIALGPALPQIAENCYSLLLIADNGGVTGQHLYALTIRGVVSPSPLQRWRQDYWGTTNNTADAANSADPDSDRIPNLFEYAMDSNPVDADTDALFTNAVADDRVRIHFTLSTNAVGVAVWTEKNAVGMTRPEWWTTDGITEMRITNGAQISVEARVDDPTPESLTNLFLRLRAEEP